MYSWSLEVSPLIRRDVNVFMFFSDNCLFHSCTVHTISAPFVSSSTSFWYQFRHFLLTYSFTHYFFLFWFTTLRIHNSLSLSITPGLKPTFFTNPTPVVSLLPPTLPWHTIAWTVHSKLLGFCFNFSFFDSVPCARLSWPSRQLFSAR